MDERLWGAQDEKEDTEQAEGTDDRRTKVSPTASPCSLEKKKRGRREKEREREREREGGGAWHVTALASHHSLLRRRHTIISCAMAYDMVTAQTLLMSRCAGVAVAAVATLSGDSLHLYSTLLGART